MKKKILDLISTFFLIAMALTVLSLLSAGLAESPVNAKTPIPTASLDLPKIELGADLSTLADNLQADTAKVETADTAGNPL